MIFARILPSVDQDTRWIRRAHLHSIANDQQVSMPRFGLSISGWMKFRFRIATYHSSPIEVQSECALEMMASIFDSVIPFAFEMCAVYPRSLDCCVPL